MKTLFSLALVAMLSLLSACEIGTDPSVGTISGTVTLTQGSINLSNARVAIYRTLQDLQDDNVLQSVNLTGSAPQWTFTMRDVDPGSYYLDVCKEGIGCIVFSETGAQPSLVPVEGGRVTTVTINVSAK